MPEDGPGRLRTVKFDFVLNDHADLESLAHSAGQTLFGLGKASPEDEVPDQPCFVRSFLAHSRRSHLAERLYDIDAAPALLLHRKKPMIGILSKPPVVGQNLHRGNFRSSFSSFEFRLDNSAEHISGILLDKF